MGNLKLSTTNRNILFIAFAGLGLLIAIYANHFNNGFHFDDIHTIVNNVFIRDLKNIPAYFVDPKMFSADPAHWGLRSLVTTTLAIDYWLGGGLDPFYFQLSTFLWHIALCACLYFLYKRLLKTVFDIGWASYLAIAATLFYALHKANAETLNYIISRSDVLSTFMIVLSLLMYISWPEKRKYCLYIIPAFLGVFAKETMLVLVIILFFYILLFEKKLSIGDLFTKKHFTEIFKTIWQIMPLIAIVLLTQIYTLTRITSIPGISNPLLPYLLTEAFVWVHYFISFFVPANLSADSDWHVFQNAYDERVIIGCIFVAGLIWAIIKTSLKAETRPIAFGLIWFAASLLPTSLAPFAEVTNDHRMYFPFIGLALSIACYVGLLLKKYEAKAHSKRMISFAVAIFLCALMLNAYGVTQRNKVWYSEESLWKDVTIQSPENGRGMMNYGIALMTDHNYALAGYYFNKAKIYNPTYNLLYINIGILDGFNNKPQDAEQNFQYGIALDTTYFGSYYFYAQFLVKYNRTKDAQPIAEKALALNPYAEKSANLLMGIYYKQQLWDKLKTTAQNTLKIVPNEHAAIAYLEAMQNNKPVLLSDDGTVPTEANDYVNLSLKYYNSGEYQKCIDACNEALKLYPNDADAYCNLGAAYNKLHKWNEAITASKKALQISPGLALAAGNLSFAESQLQKK